jgi:broad specificity phosphatase PhoE
MFDPQTTDTFSIWHMSAKVTAMASKVIIVRHAESVHNVTKDFSQLDPPLTTLGVEQASSISQKLPAAANIATVISSPLKRAVQTTLAGFSSVLDKQYFDESSGQGIDGGATLSLDPDLQERSDLPCDTGSSASELAKAFPELNFDDLGEKWLKKSDWYAASDDAVRERAERTRQNLAKVVLGLENGKRKDIVVVTHGVFMKFLTEDQEIDLPKAGWRAYTIQKHGEKVVLVAQDDSI